MRMRRTEFVPLFGVAVLSAVSCLAAPQQKRGFDKPLVIVADDFGAFFKDEKNEMTKAGLEAYARTREKGASPWLTIRMSDTQYRVRNRP